MELKTLEAKPRTAGGTNAAGRLRREGVVPGVVYGLGQDASSLTVNKRELTKLLHDAGEHAVVNIAVPDAPAMSGPALVKDVQHHPVKGDVVHVDFLRVNLKEKLQTVVQILLVGRSKGVQDGGVLDHQLREVEVECLPTNVPEHLELDVSEVGIGDSLHVSDIVAPEGVTIITEGERAVLAVLTPRVVKTAAEEAAEAAAAADAAAAAPKTES
ncbi:MAG: 50S ribosomal protein L25 [Candidatus Hydrogenedentota bacterium]